MIIAISGKATSGKDTVAKLLQLIFDNRNTGILDESTNLLKYIDDIEVMSAINNTCGWPVRRFAEPLKRHLADLLGVSLQKLESQEFKSSILGPEWARRFDYESNKVDLHPMTVRDLMIGVGDGLRNIVHPDYWVNGFRANYKEGDNVIITDMRYPNEFAYTNPRGMTIRVQRPGVRLIDSKSETSLDGVLHAYHINNNGTIEDLFTKVIEALHDYEHSDTNVD